MEVRCTDCHDPALSTCPQKLSLLLDILVQILSPYEISHTSDHFSTDHHSFSPFAEPPPEICSPPDRSSSDLLLGCPLFIAPRWRKGISWHVVRARCLRKSFHQWRRRLDPRVPCLPPLPLDLLWSSRVAYFPEQCRFR